MTQNRDLKTRVEDWLSEQGYPLEMKVASSLQRVGFRVFQSEYFTDPESGDSREIDIVAFKLAMIMDVPVRVSLYIECKRSTEKPWLLFTSNMTQIADRARVAQRASNSLGRYLLARISNHSTIQNLPIFSLPDRPAYGVTQALTSGKDVCYSAVTSVSKAALAEITELDKEYSDDPEFPKFCSIVFPIIVVEGKMFEVFLNDDTGVEVSEIDRGVLLWRNPIVRMPHTIVHIVSWESFDDFKQKAIGSIDGIFELVKGPLIDSFRRAIELDKLRKHPLS